MVSIRGIQKWFVVALMLFVLGLIAWAVADEMGPRQERNADKVVMFSEPTMLVRTIYHEDPWQPDYHRSAAVYRLEADKEELDRCLTKITRNWKREVDGETVRGYDERFDWAYRDKLWTKLQAGERIC